MESLKHKIQKIKTTGGAGNDTSRKFLRFFKDFKETKSELAVLDLDFHFSVSHSKKSNFCVYV